MLVLRHLFVVEALPGFWLGLGLRFEFERVQVDSLVRHIVLFIFFIERIFLQFL